MAIQSNLPTIQRLKYEDYSKSANWQDSLKGLISSLNLFINPVYNILNGNIGYPNLQVPQTFTKVIVGAATTAFSFINPLTTQPQAVILGNCWSGISSNHPAVALQVFWHYTGNTIIIDNIVGLTVGTTYNLVMVVL